MKALILSPKPVITLSAVLVIVAFVLLIGSMGIGHWKWSNSPPPVLQAQNAQAEPAGTSSSVMPDKIESSANASSVPVSQLVESQSAPIKDQSEKNQPNDNVALGVAGGVSQLLLAQATVSLPVAAPVEAGKKTLAILSIKPIPSLLASIKSPDKTLELNRIIESMDGQLIDRINATRKFQIVSRSDLNEVLKEQDFDASGNVDPKTAAEIGKLTGATNILTATVDDFQDYVEHATFEGTGRMATKRLFRFSIVAKIYETKSGKLVESANFQTGNDQFKQIQQDRNYVVKDGELSDEMMVAVSRTLAEEIATHIVDVIFPAKILFKHDTEVTINRGEGVGVSVGDTFNVYAVGEEMFDPDTKESLGREEVKVGSVKITEVDPKFSKAQILEDTGITNGAVLRKPQGTVN